MFCDRHNMLTHPEMIREAVLSLNGTCTNSQIKSYVLKKWPGQNSDSIDAQINSACVNIPSRVNYPENEREVSTPREKYDILFRKARGLVELYNPEKHGNWGIFNFHGKYRIFKGETPPDISDYEEKYGIIYHTDQKWLEFIKKSGLQIINFWNFRTDMLTGVYDGMPLFFKTSDQKIAGFGTFVRAEKMIPLEAWATYGEGNGAQSREEFFNLLNKDRPDNAKNNQTQITCFILRDPVFFANPPSLYDCGIPTFQTMRYIDSIEASIVLEEIDEFIPNDLNAPAEVSGPVHSHSTTDSRPYQTVLKKYLLKTYKGKCAICGMDVPELLRVSHIIPHSSDDSTAKRLDNSILLCSTHDSLFDKGLITLRLENGEYNIKLSSTIRKSKNTAVVKIRNDLSEAVFHPPADHPPSEKSLKFHNSNIFIDGKDKTLTWE